MANNEKPLPGNTPAPNPLRHTLMPRNYRLMALAGVVIVVGFLLMLGKSSGTDAYNPDIYSTRRIVIGPLIAFIGYIFMGFAVMWNFRKASPTATESDSAAEK